MSNANRIVHRNIHGWTSRKPRPVRRRGVTLYALVLDDGTRILHAGDKQPVALPRDTVKARPYTRPEDRDVAQARREIAAMFVPSLLPVTINGAPARMSTLHLRMPAERIAAARHAESLR